MISTVSDASKRYRHTWNGFFGTSPRPACGEGKGNMMNNCLYIYTWKDAPQDYRDLSEHGGDEDWVLVVSQAVRNVAYWPWNMSDVIDGDEDSYLQGFGHVDRHELPNGDLVVIFAHA